MKESKPGLFPAEYVIPPVNAGEKFNLLIVLDGRRPVFLDGERGSEYMFVSSESIANSLVQDYITGQPALGVENIEECQPGLFWTPGEMGRKDVETKLVDRLAKYSAAQKKWWQALVRLADDLWTANHQYNQISDLERTACRQLGVKRDWLDDSPDSIIKCPVCTTLVSSSAIVCFACKVILNPEEYKKFQFVNPQMVTK